MHGWATAPHCNAGAEQGKDSLGQGYRPRRLCTVARGMGYEWQGNGVAWTGNALGSD